MIRRWLLVFIVTAGPSSGWCWDYDYHRLINEWALRSLPADFPAFVKEKVNSERIAFLAGEPDRWRNTPEPSLKHVNEPEHFFDLEELEPLGLKPDSLRSLRHEYVAQIALARRFHVRSEGRSDPESPVATRLPGLLPWRISEDFARLKSTFSCLKTYEARGGTADEIENSKANAVYIMGVMGHFVGDAAQPLHTTRNYNGWLSPNPEGFTTNRAFHGWIDGKFLEAVHFNSKPYEGRLRDARIPWANGSETQPNRPFTFAVKYVVDQNPKVEILYRLEKDRKLSPDPGSSREAQELLGAQLVLAAQTLGDLWYAAFQESTEDVFLRSALAQRQLKEQREARP